MGGSGATRAWKCGALERARAWNAGLWSWFVGRVWPAVSPRRCQTGRGRRRNGLKVKKFENDRLRSGKYSKIVMLLSGFFKILFVKMIMLWSGNLGPKMGVSKMAHTQYAHILWKCPRGVFTYVWLWLNLYIWSPVKTSVIHRHCDCGRTSRPWVIFNKALSTPQLIPG